MEIKDNSPHITVVSFPNELGGEPLAVLTDLDYLDTLLNIIMSTYQLEFEQYKLTKEDFSITSVPFIGIPKELYEQIERT